MGAPAAAGGPALGALLALLLLGAAGAARQGLQGKAAPGAAPSRRAAAGAGTVGQPRRGDADGAPPPFPARYKRGRRRFPAPLP